MSGPCCHLHVHSKHSFKDGLAPEEELVARAVALGQPAIGLTNHGNLYGAAAFFKACKAQGIQGIIGMEAYEAAVPYDFDMERDGPIFKIKWADLGDRHRYYHLTLWALDLTGWQNLCRLHTISFSETHLPPGTRGKPLVDRAMLERYGEGIAVGMGCMASRANQLIDRGDLDGAYEAAKWYAERFEDRFVIEVMGNLPEQQALIRPQRQIARRLGRRTMATNDVHYVDEQDGVENGPHHVLVQARAFRKADTEASTDRADDGFASWYGSSGFFMKSYEQWLATGGIDRAEIEETVAFASRFDFDFSALPAPAPPSAPVPAPGQDPGFDLWLRSAA